MKLLRRTLLILSLALAVLAASAPGEAEAQRSHTVRPGQSLSRIARRYRVDVWDLALANRMRRNDPLQAGQTLTIPPRGVTYVRPGQTLSHIARDHHCSVEELVRLNRLRRRSLRAGQRLILPGFLPEEQEERDWGEPDEPGVARIRRRDEVVSVRLRDAEGRVTEEALQQLASLMRRHDDDPPELPHPRLALLLAAISDEFGGREIHLVSGRREAGGYTRESSRHTEGRATDIRVRGVPRRTLWNYCRTLQQTGCGFYPRSTFVHVDVRGRNAQWVDWSRPGARPRYGNLTGPFPRFCRNRGRRSHRRCAREGRRVTAPDAVATDVQLTEAALALLPEVPDVRVDETEHVDEEAEYETATDEPEEGDAELTATAE
ncbi:MAG: LysM peptidoglycan-binding domain-containing protein [Myxococcota bacterium]|nr:LysM peptidoglycan-binding domain-containing protein [Myxococcota bacterium]